MKTFMFTKPAHHLFNYLGYDEWARKKRSRNTRKRINARKKKHLRALTKQSRKVNR